MITVGINGAGRIGRLTLRLLAQMDSIRVVQINDPAFDAQTLAHLVNFDSIHGRAPVQLIDQQDRIQIGDGDAQVSQQKNLADVDWSACDLVFECSGKFKSAQSLKPYLDQGVKRVVLSAPTADADIPNFVMGVNDELFNPSTHRIVSNASCTTHCLAPVVKVIHQALGIAHGSITTIHAMTNTQSILDQPHQDLRRARASSMSLIPTTTGSAKAITHIFPELTGRLNGHAVRVPLANASLTDCVFELDTPTDVETVNALFKQASEGALKGILGYEERPLVSVDYCGDARSTIVDATMTMVINQTQLKVYAWYDNEWGYSNRLVELGLKVINAPRG